MPEIVGTLCHLMIVPFVCELCQLCDLHTLTCIDTVVPILSQILNKLDQQWSMVTQRIPDKVDKYFTFETFDDN